MNDRLVFELCAETPEACRLAASGGAHRIEFCTALEVGGHTPDADLLSAAVEVTSLPVHVLLRPAGDNFQYTPALMDAISTSMEELRGRGAAGFVLGLLDAEGRVDVEHTRALVEQAHPLPVTFHRAFDVTPDLPAALEDVIATGCTRLLTSGGAPDVLTGAPVLARLVEQAAGRIEIAAGGGLTQENAIDVAQITGCRHFHGSLKQGNTEQPLEERLRIMVRTLGEAQRTLAPEVGSR